MPPKRKTTPKRTAAAAAASPKTSSGQKRKRPQKPINRPQIEWTPEKMRAKLKEIKAEHEQKKEEDAKRAAEEGEDSPETSRPAKRRKPTPQSQKSTSSAKVAPAASTTRALKDPPPAATPPRRAAAAGAKSASDRALFSPNPRGSDSKTRATRNKAPVDEDDEDEDTGAVPPPAKPAAGRRGKPKQDDTAPGPSSEEDEEVDYDEDDSTDEDNPKEAVLMGQLNDLQQQDRLGGEPPAPAKSSTSAVIRFIVVALVTAYGVRWLPENVRANLPAFLMPGTSVPVCFRDSPHTQDEEYVKTSTDCLGEEGPVWWQECPTDAYCRGGKLLTCPDGFVVEASGCFLSAISNETLRATVDLLQKWTAQDICHGYKEGRANYGFGGRPLFHYSRISGELETGYQLGLVKLANHSRFVLSSSKNGDVWIGLHPKVHVPLTYACHSKRFFLTLCGIAWGIFWKLFDFTWQCVMGIWLAFCHEPLRMFFTFLFLWFVCARAVQTWKQRTENLRISNDMYQCRKHALELMSSSPDEVFTMEKFSRIIIWKMYSTSTKGRERMNFKVMPQLANALREDPRVRITRGVRNGKPVDLFKWAGTAMDGHHVHFEPGG